MTTVATPETPTVEYLQEQVAELQSKLSGKRHAKGGTASRGSRVIIHPDDIPACKSTPEGRTILASAGYGDYNSVPQADEQTGLMPAEKSSSGFTGLNVSTGFIQQEYNARIRTLADRLTVFEEMRRSDDAVALIELLTTSPLANCTYKVQPGDDPEWAEFLQWNLDEGLTIPFSETMRDAAMAMLYGFTWCYPALEKKTYKGRQWVGWDQFEPRARATTYQWRFDDRGRCIGLISYGLHPVTGEPTYVSYDSDEILRWTWRPDGGDPEGCGAFRQAFKSYSYKEAGEEYAIIKIERESMGVLVASCREEVPYNEGDEALVLASMANIRAGRTNGITLPDGWTIDVLNIGSSGAVPFLDFIEKQRRNILSSVGAQFVGGDIGSGIGTKDASNVFFMLLDNAGDWICDWFNVQAIPQLARANGIVEERKAKLTHGPVAVKDIEKFVMAFEKLTRHPENIDDEVLETLHDEIGLRPPKDGAQAEAIKRAMEMKKSAQPALPAAPEGGAEGGEENDDKQGGEAGGKPPQ